VPVVGPLLDHLIAIHNTVWLFAAVSSMLGNSEHIDVNDDSQRFPFAFFYSLLSDLVPVHPWSSGRFFSRYPCATGYCGILGDTAYWEIPRDTRSMGDIAGDTLEIAVVGQIEIRLLRETSTHYTGRRY